MTTRPPRPLRGALAALAALVPLAGCGQTGPLFLPDDESTTVITRPAPAAAPAPAPTAAPPADARADETPPTRRDPVETKR
jgi:predicted small lipoprotein YifL